MKASTIRSALEGHGWIGLFISIPLFIVFWAGSLTLFYPELKAWSVLPHTEFRSAKDALPLSEIVDSALSEHDVDMQERMFVVLPTDTLPLYELYLPVKQNEADHTELTSLYVDPANGKTVAPIASFHLADFLYGLHIDLNLPMGGHIVGIITLFFTVVIFTGLIVQFKKLITHFFYYRGSKATQRYQLTDMHNVIGVMSLPYTFMYALTGLMFNLGLISQIVTLLFVYDGNRTALLNDSGFPKITESYAGIEREMPDLDALVASWEEEQHAKAHSLRLTNYGDENALIRIIGQHETNFSQRIDITYRVRENAFSTELNPSERNAFADGTRFLYALHFGHFAGLDIRVVFFILGLAVCGLIVVGNMLWLNKFQNNRSISKRFKRNTSALTLGGCAGIIPATALAFLLERTLAAGLDNRALMVEAAFFLVYGLSVVATFFIKNGVRTISVMALVSGGVLALLTFVDVISHSRGIMQYFNGNYKSLFSVSLTCFSFSCLLLWLGMSLLKKSEVTRHTNTGHQ
ncbi:PepSY domain-containing protein [Alteromonas sp. BL110]|uniref:PepSY-associated TM helix domain-containing protein n=1 Tax=Alteromonas sp. BL110 TaxID=1714845 RepID=UPI000E468222|nr:PepSY-associated TM helix domain-containing protein [Alteromonas sp. BL110]AXT40302.1 PepSY domain-containing protein [Alteromonas sp. BL110]RKM79534.1 PepSY domain-containing protein [Alteromonas sp. BL110]